MSQFSRLTSNLGRRMISSIAAKNGVRRPAMPSFRPPSTRSFSDAASIEKAFEARGVPMPLGANPFANLPSFAPVNSSLLASSPATRVTTLPNGLRVASESNAGATATIGVWMDIGSRFEKPEDNGVAHFLEHLTFKGTPRRSRYQLESEIENMGGHLNAYTSREQTVYYAKVFSSDVGNAFDILSDILKNSKLDSEDINRERDVILREMQEVDANLGEVIFDRLHETAYRGTALSRTILGSIENIRTINQQQLKNYVATHYTAPHMVIAGTGGVKHEELVKLAEKYFGDIPKAPPAGKAPYFEPARFTGSDIRVRNDELPEAHVALAFETSGWVDAANFPLMVIQTMLGSWDCSTHGGQHSSSPLVATVAEKDLASRFTTFNTQYSDTGLFGVYFVAEPTSLMEFSAELMRNLGKLSRDIDPARLEEAKTVLKMTMLSHLDGTTAIAEDIGRQLLVYGRRMHPTELIARIDAVDEAAIKETAQRFFWDKDVAIAGLGNLYELPDYNWFRSRTYLDRF